MAMPGLSAQPLRTSRADAATPQRTWRWLDFSAALLLALSFAAIQVMIGGTRLLFSLPAYGLLALMSLLALASVRRTRPKPHQACLLVTALFLGYVLGRAVFSPVEYLARADIYSVLAGLLVYLLVACAFTETKPRLRILFFLLAVAAVQVFIGIIQFRRGDNYMPIPGLHRFDYDRRASGFYVCPNHLAGLLEVLGIFAVSIACWSRYPLWAKILVGYAAAICYLGVILTGSRGGYLSTITSLTVFTILSLWLSRRSSSGSFWRMTAIGAAIAIVIGIGVTFLISKSDFLTGRAQNVFDTRNMRVELWHAALEQWKLAPVVGTGSGTYLYYGRQFRSPNMQFDPVRAHNDYLDLLAEYGAVGVALMAIFVLVHLGAGWKDLANSGHRRESGSAARSLSNGLALQLGAVAAVSAYIVHSIFDFNLHIPANVLLMAFVFGIVANPGSNRNQASVRPQWFDLVWRLVPAAIAVVIAIQCVRLLPGEYFAERARLALRRQHAGTTIRFVERALETEQKNPNLYDYLGGAQLMRGDARSKPDERAWFYRRALEAFHNGRKLAPRDEDFPLQLGNVYDKLGRFEEAEWMYYEALELDPNSIWAHHFYNDHLELWRSGGKPKS